MSFAFIKYFIKHFSSKVKDLIHKWRRLITFYLLSENIVIIK